VVGLVEAIAKLRFARRLIKNLVAEAKRRGARGAILTDSPDFNLPLARKLHKAGIPVIFYVSPQVWAWRSRRAKKLYNRGKAILALFEFEKRWYEARGFGDKVHWVGHPLVDTALSELGGDSCVEPPDHPVLALMPGSRKGEVTSLLPMMTEAARRLKKRHANLEVVLVKADSITEELIDAASSGEFRSWRVVSGAHFSELLRADVLLVASGTATLEGLLAHVPMVVLYRVHPLTFFLAKRLVRVAHIAMANIIADPGTGERTVPELVQKDATPDRVTAEAERFLTDPATATRTRLRLKEASAGLGPPGAASRTADAILTALRLRDSG
jgi:lipid-A-disaccharide synthase